METSVLLLNVGKVEAPGKASNASRQVSQPHLQLHPSLHQLHILSCTQSGDLGVPLLRTNDNNDSCSWAKGPNLLKIGFKKVERALFKVEHAPAKVAPHSIMWSDQDYLALCLKQAGSLQPADPGPGKPGLACFPCGIQEPGGINQGCWEEAQLVSPLPP